MLYPKEPKTASQLAAFGRKMLKLVTKYRKIVSKAYDGRETLLCDPMRGNRSTSEYGLRIFLEAELNWHGQYPNKMSNEDYNRTAHDGNESFYPVPIPPDFEPLINVEATEARQEIARMDREARQRRCLELIEDIRTPFRLTAARGY